MQPEYVKERLASLDEIDLKLCSMLQQASHVVHSFSEVKAGGGAGQGRPQFSRYVTGFYTDLEEATVRLRREIQLLDENVGTRLLPISVNKKALGQDDEKLAEQVALLRATLGGHTYRRQTTPDVNGEEADVKAEDNEERDVKAESSEEKTEQSKEGEFNSEKPNEGELNSEQPKNEESNSEQPNKEESTPEQPKEGESNPEQPKEEDAIAIASEESDEDVLMEDVN